MSDPLVLVKRPRKRRLLKRKAKHFEADSKAEPLERAFMIKPVAAIGMTLYKVVMLVLQEQKVIERMDITSPDTKTNALHRLRISAFQYYFEEKLPQDLGAHAAL